MEHNFEVLEYSIKNLSEILLSESKTPSQVIEKQVHLTYFEEYFNMLGARTILCEYKYIDRDFFEDFASYYVKSFHDYSRFATRLHFFNFSFNSSDFLSKLTSGDQSNYQNELNNAYLGFIVVKPIPKTFIGRTCLKTYPHSEYRNYPFIRKYAVNLFGIKLSVKSLAFQQQDSVVAACASSALWTTFHATGRIFQHSIPSPVEITRSALKIFPNANRHFPNKGLTYPSRQVH